MLVAVVCLLFCCTCIPFPALCDDPSTRDKIPSPDDLMGDLKTDVIHGQEAEEEGDDEEEDDEEAEDILKRFYQNTDKRKACLRENKKVYLSFCKEFVPTVMFTKNFKRVSKTSTLSKYMTPQLEAFMVILYLNNYEKWMSEWTRAQGGEGEVVETRFTQKCRGRGKHGGWSEEGKELYAMVVWFLSWQRKEASTDDALASFDVDLRTVFQDGKGGGSHRAAKKRKLFSDSLDDSKYINEFGLHEKLTVSNEGEILKLAV